MHLSTDLLRTFVAVIETASFTRAGERVSRTQSAVSQQIRRLEEELGQRLLDRDGREVRPTPRGEDLLSHARRLLRAHDDAVAALARPEISGLVRFGAPDDYATGYLPDVLSRFAATHPRVQVEVHCASSPELRGWLLRDELDLVVHSCERPPKGAELIGHEPLSWVTSARRPAHEQTPVPLAVYDQGCHFRKWALAALDRAAIPYRIAYISRSLAGIQAAVTAGLAVAPLGGFIPAGTRLLGSAEGFPELPTSSLALLRGKNRTEPVERLAETVAEGLRACLGRIAPRPVSV